MIPSYGESLINDEQLMRKIRKQTSKDLELGYYDKAKNRIDIFNVRCKDVSHVFYIQIFHLMPRILINFNK